MIVNFDTAKINRTLYDFYNATGIYMELFREDLSSVGDRSHWANNSYCHAVQSTQAGRKACMESDRLLLEKCRTSRCTEMHICHAGLLDAAVPILYKDTFVGCILFGQMRADSDFSSVRDYLHALGLPTEQMEEDYLRSPILPADKIDSISRIAGMLVEHILLEDLLRPDCDENIRRAVVYIDENLENELSVQSIAQAVNISKSVLYRRFHSCFHCTVSAYITSRRLERAAELLTQTDLSVEEISRRTGFSGASYFSRNFKKEKGISPLKYRKTQRA